MNPERPTPHRPWWSLAPLANHYPALHGIRVLAILSVLQVHLTVALVERRITMSPLPGALSIKLWFGMDLFFILSGFLIGSLLLHDSGKFGLGKLRRFYLRRSFRIFPQYYVVLTLVALTFPLSQDQLEHLVFEYLYLTNYLLEDHETVMRWAWSLAVEEHFYLAVPFLLAALALIRGTSGRLLLLLVLWLLALGLRAQVLSTQPQTDPLLPLRTAYVQTHTRMDILVAGVFVAYLQRHHAETLRLWIAKTWVRALGACWIVGFLFLLWIEPFFLVDPFHPTLWQIFAWGTGSSLMYIPMLLWLLNGDGPTTRILGRPIFLRLATLGYGIYLLHIPLLHWVIMPALEASHGPGQSISLSLWWVSLLGLFAVSAACSWLLHVLIDKPALKLRDRWAP